MRRDHKIDMTQGALLPKILLFALPLMASSTLQLLFNAADIVVVGRFVGANALAGVGANSSLINLFVNIFLGLSIGANVVAAKYMGARKEELVSQTVHTAMLIALYGGIIILVLGFFIASPVLTAMGTPEEVLPLAVLYLRIYFCGMPAMLLYNFGASLLRAIGDTRRPLVYLFIAGVFNVALNLLFVIVFHMSVAGVALATVLSQCISTALVIRCLVRSEGSIRLILSRSTLVINSERFGEIFKIGIPAGLQGVVFSLSNILIQSSVNSFGAVAVAGNTAGSNIEGFIYTAMNASYQACVSFTSQNFGARKPDRILRVMLLCVACVFTTGIVLGYGAYFGGNTLLGLYSDSPEVIAVGMRRLKVILTTYFLCGIMEIPVGTLRGMGYGVVPMVISLLGACAFRIVWILTVFASVHTLESLYVSYPISWAITGTAQFIAAALAYIKYKKRITVDAV
ncbi:MAG: MATE family efflux transporter [Lachnospiraceae bacterium]|nr:MATE family efflux transporter [Lachnospiraceae bacterium]